MCIRDSLYTDAGFESVFRTYYGMAAVVFDITENVKFKPSVLLSYNRRAPFDMDLNASFLLMNSLWVGATYRLGDSVDALIQYQFTPSMRGGVAVDFTTSELSAATTAGFEFMFEYIFQKKGSQLTNIRYF